MRWDAGASHAAICSSQATHLCGDLARRIFEVGIVTRALERSSQQDEAERARHAQCEAHPEAPVSHPRRPCFQELVDADRDDWRDQSTQTRR